MPPTRPGRLASCLATLFAYALASACGQAPSADRVVLVSIDTLRADRVGCLGAGPGRTPTLDALCDAGAAFEAAFSPTPLTLPSHASLFTALDPPRHGVRNNGTFRLVEDIPTLAERMQAGGFATAAFVGAQVLDRRHGLGRGFDHYDDAMGLRESGRGAGFPERRADAVVDAALAWLETAPPRFLLWVHLYDPHADYAPPPAHLAAAGDPYSGEIHFADAELGRLLAAVERRHPDTRTLVAITSDHGESLGEHDEATHAYGVYDATQHIPLLLRGPGVPAGRRIGAPVRLIDVAPTLLSLLRLPPLGDTDGRDLTPLLGESSPDPERVTYLETLATQIDLGASPLLAVRTADHKYIRAPRPELYDLREDPGELRDLAALEPELARSLDALLAAQLARGGTAPAAGARMAISPAQRAALEQLGYLAGDPTPGSQLGVVGGLDPKDLRRTLFLPLGRAERALAAHRPRRAERALGHVEGGGVRVLQSRARIELGLGDAFAAEALAREALALSPANTSSTLLLGRALEAQGQARDAQSVFEGLRQAGGDPTGAALTGLGRLAEASGAARDAEALYRTASGEGNDAEALWRRAALHLEAGEAEAARGLLSALPAPARSDPALEIRLAWASFRRGGDASAFERLARAIDAFPERPDPPLVRAEMAIGRGRPEQALDDLADLETRLAPLREPLAAQVAFLRARALVRLADPGANGAIAAALAAVDANPALPFAAAVRQLAQSASLDGRSK